VQKAPLNKGFEAYYTLLDGFVFASATSASLLLNELTNFRFKKDETPTELVLRLEELFQELKSLPGEAAMVFNDTQCIGYLLGALRHEKEWDHVGYPGGVLYTQYRSTGHSTQIFFAAN
jgi:hypothetical protein